jgi:acyl-CoA reductase-like NAD-dependent aldehyde dehydrogenase
VVAEVGTGILGMVDAHRHHEVEEIGVRVAIQNFQETKSRLLQSLAKKMRDEYQDLGELIVTETGTETETETETVTETETETETETGTGTETGTENENPGGHPGEDVFSNISHSCMYYL